jgi:hypothetical protein
MSRPFGEMVPVSVEVERTVRESVVELGPETGQLHSTWVTFVVISFPPQHWNRRVTLVAGTAAAGADHDAVTHGSRAR